MCMYENLYSINKNVCFMFHNLKDSRNNFCIVTIQKIESVKPIESV